MWTCEYEKQKAEDPEFYRDANSLAVRLSSIVEDLSSFGGFLPESPGQNLVLTVLCVPYLLESGTPKANLMKFQVGGFANLKSPLIGHFLPTVK